MPTRVKIDQADEGFWIQMSILEIRAQAQFAKMAYDNIAEKPGTGDEWAVYSSIHSFLSHCSMISKMLKAKGSKQSIGQVLGISNDSIIHKRRFRNNLEHYDNELKRWINKAGVGSEVVNHQVGNRNDFPIKNAIFVSFYDPFTKIFTFVDEDFNLAQLSKESQKIQLEANKCLGFDE